MPGYSDYLHPLNGTHLIGVGKDASTDGRVRGLKLALFDASTPAYPAEAYSLTIGDRQTHSAALDDHKAFAFDSSACLLTLPMRLYLSGACPTTPETIGDHSWPKLVWQGAVLWRVGERSFELQGLVPHYDPSAARPPPVSTPSIRAACTDTCYSASDGACDDGGTGAEFATCAGGSDCDDCGEPAAGVIDAGSGGATQLPSCPRYELPACAGSVSTAVVRAIYMNASVLYTISAGRIRADSIETMLSLTRTAIEVMEATSATAAPAVAAWEAALAGSRLAEISLPHAMCGEYGSMPRLDVAPEPLESRLSEVASPAARASAAGRSSAPLCECVCTSSCDLRGATQITAARAVLGL